MFKYTLAFIKRKDEILMLNRNKSPWMGSWNGVGGKVNENETAINCIIREVYEETGINVNKEDVIDKGYVTWNSNEEYNNGLHVYLINLDDNFIYVTPRKVLEGILDWKKIDWISDFENYGVCDNIPYFINDVIFNKNRYNHKCIFDDKILIEVKKDIIETD